MSDTSDMADAGEVFPDAAPYETLYSDDDLLAINKPPALVVHPTYKHPDGTLTDAIFAWCEARGESRPWLLHRLDKDTSGVTLFARTEAARRGLARQFAQRLTNKRYLALAVWPDGAPLAGLVDAPLWRDPLDRRKVIIVPEPVGQASRTRYRALVVSRSQSGRVYALMLAEPETGRTHQIRAHLTSIGAPLVGDSMYLPDGDDAALLAPRVMLHAWKLAVRWPANGERRTITAPLPADFRAVARALGFASAVDDLDALVAEADAVPDAEDTSEPARTPGSVTQRERLVP